MAKFYLNYQDASGRADDEEGSDHPDLKAARIKAIECVRDIISADVRSGELDLTRAITIDDASGREVLVVQFDEAVAIRR